MPLVARAQHCVFFGGWDYPDTLCESEDMIAQGYAGGVPMGGDLPAAKDGTPRFLVSASMDNGTSEYPGSPLQRLQLIKGWYEDGELHEQVMDVAGGDNSATVDIYSCEQTGGGHKQLCSVWEDSNFNPNAPASTTPGYWKILAAAGASESARMPEFAAIILRAFPKAWKTAARRNTRK